MRPAETARRDDCTWRVALMVWGLAAVVRLIYIAAARPAFTIYYWDAATSLLEDGSLSSGGVKTTLLEPLYPLFLAGVRWLLGDRPLLVQGAQALVASVGAIYLYKLTLALTARKDAAAAAAALYGLYPLLVRHAVAGVESALLTTLLIAFAYQFVTIRTVWGAAATGAWLGLAVLTRAVALPLVLAAPLVSAFRSGRTADAVTMASVTILVLAPFGLRNYTLNGTIIPARGGVNLFISNCEYAPGVVATYGADILLTYAESKLAAEGLLDLPPTPDLERQQDAAYFRLALAEIRRHPGNTLALKIRNVFDFFSPILVPHRETTDATTIRFGQSGQSTIEHTVARPLAHRVAYSASYGLVLALAAFGVYVRRRGLAADSILWCVLLTFTAVYVVFFPSTHYRAPVEFVLLFYAGAGIAAFSDVWRASRARQMRSSVTAA